MRAVTTLDVFSLSKEHFSEILEEYPEMKQTLQTVALERLNKIGMPAPPKLSTPSVDKSDDTIQIGLSPELQSTLLQKRRVTFADDVDVANRRWSEPIERTSVAVELHPRHRKRSLLTTGKRMMLDKDIHQQLVGLDDTENIDENCWIDGKETASTDEPHYIQVSKKSIPSLPPLIEDNLLQSNDHS